MSSLSFWTGFDNYLVLEYLVSQSIYPQLILAGSKVIYMHYTALDIKFLCSLNFLPTALKNLPKMFGLSDMKKG